MSLDALLDTLECLRGRPREVTALAGGMTNSSYRVRTPERDIVVRLPVHDSPLLSVDRQAEYANALVAASSGVAPRVVEYASEHSLLVVAHVPGRTLTPEDVREVEMLHRLAAVCRQLHAGPRFVTDFDVFAIQRRYLQTVLDHGLTRPDGYLELAPQVGRIEAALGVEPVATVPCHNDLVADNVIDGGARLWLVDYEYAGNNDPCFELGNIAAASQLHIDQLATLVTAYFGRPVPQQVARARLFMAVALYAWTAWASIQAATSPLDFDFRTWGVQTYDRAVALLEGPELDALLSAAQRAD